VDHERLGVQSCAALEESVPAQGLVIAVVGGVVRARLALEGVVAAGLGGLGEGFEDVGRPALDGVGAEGVERVGAGDEGARGGHRGKGAHGSPREEQTDSEEAPGGGGEGPRLATGGANGYQLARGERGGRGQHDLREGGGEVPDLTGALLGEWTQSEPWEGLHELGGGGGGDGAVRRLVE